MSPELIAYIVGVVISLLMEYAIYKGWRFAEWFNGLSDTEQKLFMLGVGLVVVYGAFGLGCLALIPTYWACTTAGAVLALKAWLAYVFANQTTYALFLKKSK